MFKRRKEVGDEEDAQVRPLGGIQSEKKEEKKEFQKSWVRCLGPVANWGIRVPLVHGLDCLRAYAHVIHYSANSIDEHSELLGISSLAMQKSERCLRGCTSNLLKESLIFAFK